ncbi:hypothetical protein J2T60_002329 [Natronospira proteinivora]|uniref:Signal transducing protein n=1 Tax=Natronospira proteinivora TaxID=1807133 RepID=A0ABT1GAH8_9GAMM|nr:DUF2007 domain-containing protein [Natronospira proteinivora]MCP1728329.1 hypothetical protein [Natronospira proteinivora]
MLVTIASYTEPWEAHIVRGRLEAEGVPATLAHDQHVSLDWPLATALGGVKVQVPPAFVEQALGIEADYRNGAYITALQAIHPDTKAIDCPECGSDRLRSHASWPLTLLALMSLGIASIIFPPATGRRSCRDCYHHWVPDE